MAFVLTVAGVEQFFLPGSLKIQETANGRNNLSLDIPSANGSYRPQIGDEVLVREDGTLVFGGIIEQPTEAGIGGEGRFPIVSHLSVPDFNTYADRRYVSGLIPGGTLKTQLQALIPYLAPYGVSLAPTQVDGPTIPEIPCDFIQLSQLLDQMATMSGYAWEISYTKQLRMFSPGATPAPFNITSGDGHCIGDVTAERSRVDYANRIILRYTNAAIPAWGFLTTDFHNFSLDDEVKLGGTTYVFKSVLEDKHGQVLLGSNYTESLNNLANCISNGGDGFTSSSGTPANSQATAWVTWPDQMKALAITPGASGNNITADTDSATGRWLWEGNQPISALMGGADEALTGQVESNDFTQQQQYGMWEKIVSAASVRDLTVAQELCDALLQQSTSTITTVKYETSFKGLHPGQTQTINIPERALSGMFTITDIEIALLEKHARRLVTLTGGNVVNKRWQDDAKIMLGGSGGTALGGTFISTGGGGGGGGPAVPGMDLDYLGDYVPATYNDGDIVVDTDGIAYLCVKDGTTTPPEPWPGGPGSTLNGLGTPGRITKWTGPVTLSDSLIAESGSIVTVMGTLLVTTLVNPGGLVYSTGSGLSATATDTPRGALAPLLRSNGSAAPTWTQAQYPDYAAVDGSLIMAKGGDWVDSGLRLPYTTPGDFGIVYGSGINQWTQTNKLTFNGSQLSVTGDVTLTGFIGSATYASQTTGWRIDSLGGADFRYLAVSEMHAKTFVTDLERALAGSEVVAKSVAVIARAFTAPALGGAATLYVKDLQSASNVAAFQDGDAVVVRAFSRGAGSLTIADCVGVVYGYVDQPDGTQSWTFYRGSGGNGGTMSPGTIVQADGLALDYGTSGMGYYEVNAIDGLNGSNSPYAQIVTWVTAPVAPNKTIRTRFGNLAGVTGVAGEYGLIAGTYAAYSGAYFRASNSLFELHGITARWWDGASNVVTIAPNAGSPYVSIGNPAPTGYGGYGVFLGWDRNAGRVQASFYADGYNYFLYDGTRIQWRAANTTLDAAGNLSATSANLSGAITATSGAIYGDFVIGTGGQIRSGAWAFNGGVGWWLDYNAGNPRFRIGNPSADQISWDGGILNVRAGKLLIDGSNDGHIGMGASPYTLATLNVASASNDVNTWGLVVSNASGNANFIAYGDGTIYINSLIRSNPPLNTTGCAPGNNPTSTWNGPFGYAPIIGWWQLIINGVTSWIPVWR